jgi:hypothetical protein
MNNYPQGLPASPTNQVENSSVILTPPAPTFNIDQHAKQGYHRHQHDLIKACIWRQTAAAMIPEALGC